MALRAIYFQAILSRDPVVAQHRDETFIADSTPDGTRKRIKEIFPPVPLKDIIEEFIIHPGYQNPPDLGEH